VGPFKGYPSLGSQLQEEYRELAKVQSCPIGEDYQEDYSWLWGQISVSPSCADLEISVRMGHSQGFGRDEWSSSSITQLSQFSHACTSVDTSEFQSKDQLTPLHILLIGF